MKKKRGVLEKTKIYETEFLTISKTDDGLLNFKIPNRLDTEDTIEAITYLLRNPQFTDSYVWNIEVDYPHITSIENSIYHLTGKDFWDGSIIKADYDKHIELFINKFANNINELLDLNKLGDMKKFIIDKLSIMNFYDYAIRLRLD